MAEGLGDIYSATYSNVPVYELKIGADHVMRRRSDDWINATHILKIAGFDKPARTRILEREVQKGVHEKIQGGYGKYQGTWVPLAEGRALAEKNHIVGKLAKIFDFVPGDTSPPPAPKHQTASSNRTKAAKPAAPQVRKAQVQAQTYYRPATEPYDNASTQYNEDESMDHPSPESASYFEDEDVLPISQHSATSRKRKRDGENGVYSAVEIEHTIYGDHLLDYFVAAGDEQTLETIFPPVPPPQFDVNKAIDTGGNTALHWACAMGDVEVARDMLARGANPGIQNETAGETPLIRAVLFTNNFDKQSFGKIVHALQNTITERDWHGATVFHHIAETARLKSKWKVARYYCEVLINKLMEMRPNYIHAVLMTVDKNHDTAVLCAIRNNCLRVATLLLNRCPEAGDVPNLKGETATEYLRMLSEKGQSLEIPPSSPTQPLHGIVGRRNGYSSKRTPPKPLSRAASHVLARLGPLVDESSVRLAQLYDTEIKEKDSSIAEGKQALANLEAQRHKIRQEMFALIAKGETNAPEDDHSPNSDVELAQLRERYHSLVGETESLLEQHQHATLQRAVLLHDQQAPPQAFRNAPGTSRSSSSSSSAAAAAAATTVQLTQDELHAALPWAVQLHHLQMQRRSLVKDVAALLADAGTGEKIGKHRKLVALATGLKEDDLDNMSGELLATLEATQSGGLANDAPPAGSPTSAAIAAAVDTAPAAMAVSSMDLS